MAAPAPLLTCYICYILPPQQPAPTWSHRPANGFVAGSHLPVKEAWDQIRCGMLGREWCWWASGMLALMGAHPKHGDRAASSRQTSRKIPVAAQYLETCGLGVFWPMYHLQRAQTPLGAVMPQSKDN